MNDELQELRNGGYKPVLVGPQPFSLEEILRSMLLGFEGGLSEKDWIWSEG